MKIDFKSSRIIYVLFVVLTACSSQEERTKAVVGDFRDGGVVFYIDPSDNTHGLVCAIGDKVIDARWYNGSLLSTGAVATDVGRGSENTSTIITSQGETEFNYAAGIARAYNGDGFNDWFLPSKNELNEMFLNKDVINAIAIENGGTSFLSDYYWSSTEKNEEYSWAQNFGYGNQFTTYKGGTLFVRAIRAF